MFTKVVVVAAAAVPVAESVADSSAGEVGIGRECL